MKKIYYLLLFLGITTQAQITEINETFDNFTLWAPLPQNGWTSNKPYPHNSIYLAQSTGNIYLVAYSAGEAEPVYLMTPELVSVSGNLSFLVGGNDPRSKVEIGLMDDAADISTFEKIAERQITGSLRRIQMNIPNSTKKFIAFKFVPAGTSKVMGIDNVVFTPSTASVSDIKQSDDHSDIIFDLNTKKLIFLDKSIKQFQVYSMQGQLVMEKQLPNKEENLSLTKGIYIVVYQNKEGEKKSTKIFVE